MSRKKQIIEYYPKFFPLIGGVEEHILEIINKIDEYNFEILTNALPTKDTVDLYKQNVKINRIPPSDYGIIPFYNHKINQFLFPFRILSDIQRLYNEQKLLKKQEFDLIHFHWPYTQSNIALLTRFWKCSLFYRPQYFKIYKPELLTVHALLSKLNNEYLFKIVETNVFNHYENIICVDKNIYEYISFERKDIKNIWYIPNCIDTEKFSFNKLQKKDKLKLGFVGRLEKSRGIELLLGLIKNKPDFIEVYIVGAGNKLAINKFIKSINLKNVFFFENLPNEKIPDFLHSIDILFNPVLAEGISRVTMESMSCGRPVIMLDKGDRYPVIHEKTGFLVENDIKKLNDLLQYIYDNNEMLERMSIEGRRIIESEYSSKVIIPKINRIYDMLME